MKPNELPQVFVNQCVGCAPHTLVDSTMTVSLKVLEKELLQPSAARGNDASDAAVCFDR